jgi:hypothetical protein
MNSKTKEFIWTRANHRCEYCQLPASNSPLTSFHIEHIRAKQHRGGDGLDNLCLSCAQCNYPKGPNPSGYDPLSDILVRLFNPRIDVWDEHFHWDGPILIGDTPEGRATVHLLQINEDCRVELRQMLIEDGEF